MGLFDRPIVLAIRVKLEERRLRDVLGRFDRTEE